MRNKNTCTYDLLKEIIKNNECDLDTKTLINKYLNEVDLFEAYSFIEELKNEGYITILPIGGIDGPVDDIRKFYDDLNEYDYMKNINQTNVVHITTKGYDYYSDREIEKWRFWIPLLISIIALITSIVSVIL